MPTLNLLVLEGDGPGPDLVAETVSILRWAAMTGPFSLNLEYAPMRAATGSRGPSLDLAVTTLAAQSDAVLVGPFEPGASVLAPLHERIDADCTLSAAIVASREGSFLPEAGVGLLTGASGPRDAGQAARILAKAFELAAERRGRLAYVPSEGAVTPRAWNDWGPPLAERFPGVVASVHPPEQLLARAARDPSQFDVVLGEPELEASLRALGCDPGAAPRVTFGRRTAVYELGAVSGGSRGQHVAALLCASMVLQHSAGRSGLAREVWSAVSVVAGEPRMPPPAMPSAEPPCILGQAVLDRLEETVIPCVSW